MKCSYTYKGGFSCAEEVSPGRSMCYYHDKLVNGAFNSYPYTEKRIKRYAYYVTHGGFNNKPFQGLEILCEIQTSSMLRRLQKEQATLQHNEMMQRIMKSSANAATPSKES